VASSKVFIRLDISNDEFQACYNPVIT